MGANERRQQIMETLCHRRQETMSNLAFEFGVSIRTIRNDIDYLSLSYPLETVRGRYGGGVKVMDGYHMNHRYLSEGCRLGIASNHSDVMHWFPKHGETMDSFRAAVKAGLAVKNTEPTKQAIGFKPYRVRLTIPNLNIRMGPGTNYPLNGKYTGVGVFTIAEEAKGPGASKWGLLMSYKTKRNGWISLDYAARL